MNELYEHCSLWKFKEFCWPASNVFLLLLKMYTIWYYSFEYIVTFKHPSENTDCLKYWTVQMSTSELLWNVKFLVICFVPFYFLAQKRKIMRKSRSIDKGGPKEDCTRNRKLFMPNNERWRFTFGLCSKQLNLNFQSNYLWRMNIRKGQPFTFTLIRLPFQIKYPVMHVYHEATSAEKWPK